MSRLLTAVGRGGPLEGDGVRLVQQLLNRFRPMPMPLLSVDGRMGPRTIHAIEDFQRRVVGMAVPDGVVSPKGPTFRALTGGHPDLERVAWGARVPSAFKRKAIAVARGLEVNPDFLMAAMAFESAETFSPSIRNAAGSGAVGLIQFMATTAKSLGTTIDALAKLTAEAQLDYVAKYFRPWRGRLHSIEDTYMAILYPKAIGKSSEDTLFTKGTRTYSQNALLDANKDGKISIAEAATAVRRKYEKGIRPGHLG